MPLLRVREEVGGGHEMRMKVDGPSWNGLVQSRPKLVEYWCMDLHVDMSVGVMVKVEVV